MLDPKDLIKEKLDIVDVIREFLALKPAGSNWKALCPFHKEKTPSFMVSPDRQTWHCFGCGAGGDVFSFVMKKEGMEFPEVLRMFAEKTGVELKRGDVKLQNQKTKLYDIMDATVAWWHERLISDEGKSAREYLHKRGVSDDVIMSWQLGLAPESWDRLSQHLVTKGFALADIIASGVVIERQRTQGDRRLPFYDRFRNRVMIPIRDHNGAVVGATGRIVPADRGQRTGDMEEAKYVNTPETLIYNKGRILFGLDRAKEAIKAADVAILVEGNMDVIASHSAGVTNVVGVSGTALTQEHAKLLHRYTDIVALCFDEDVAGQTAVRRGAPVLLAEGFSIAVITLPSGSKDPDACIQRDVALWHTAVAQRRPMFDTFFARAKERDLADVREKKAVAKEILPLIAKVSDAVERGAYIRQFAEILGVREAFLYEALPYSKNTRGDVDIPAVIPSGDRHALLSERLLALVVRYPEYLPPIIAAVTPNAIAVGPLRDLYADARALYTQQQSLTVFTTLAVERRELIDRLVLAAEHFFSSFDQLALAQEVQQSIRELKRHSIQRELLLIEQEMQRGTDGDRSATLLARTKELLEELAALSL